MTYLVARMTWDTERVPRPVMTHRDDPLRWGPRANAIGDRVERRAMQRGLFGC
jgi:hypothetical protein